MRFKKYAKWAADLDYLDDPRLSKSERDWVTRFYLELYDLKFSENPIHLPHERKPLFDADNGLKRDCMSLGFFATTKGKKQNE